MKEETRIEALEHELKILKNEIQNTLLEIREQILNHYYPELRAEEPSKMQRPVDARSSKNPPAKSISNPRLQTASLTPIETNVSVQPFTDFFLQDLEEDDEDLEIKDLGRDNQDDDDEMEVDYIPASRAMPSTTPKIREVVLDQLKPAPSAANTKAIRVQERSELQGQKASRRVFAALATWVGESVATVGKERTVQVVETYAASGDTLTKETKSSLLQLISLASDEEPETPVGNQAMLELMVELDQILSEQ